MFLLQNPPPSPVCCQIPIYLSKVLSFWEVAKAETCLQQVKKKNAVFFCWKREEVVSTFGKAGRWHYACSHSRGLCLPLHLEGSQQAFERFLMTKWNITARCDVWIVNLCCRWSQSPVRALQTAAGGRLRKERNAPSGRDGRLPRRAASRALESCFHQLFFVWIKRQLTCLECLRSGSGRRKISVHAFARCIFYGCAK